MDSPPKPMTRARAAAKAKQQTGPRSTRIVTAATRARIYPSTAKELSAATSKRKTRSDEHEDEEEDELAAQAPSVQPARARQRKGTLIGTLGNAQASTRASRAKNPGVNSDADEATQAKRSRSKRGMGPDTRDPPKVTSQSRPSSAAARTSTVPVRHAVKKSVQFQEPDKENVQPAHERKSLTMARRLGQNPQPGDQSSSKSLKASQNASSYNESQQKPLSPKKMTQMPHCRDDSEDELAGNTNPLQELRKSPSRPPTTALFEKSVGDRKAEADETAIVTSNVRLNAPEAGSLTLNSPARRPPSSPFKDSMKSPARRIGSKALSGFNNGSSQSKLGPASEQQNGFNASLLQSPAKRPPSPVKGATTRDAGQSNHTSEAFRGSLLQTPARHANSARKIGLQKQLPSASRTSPSKSGHGSGLKGQPFPSAQLIAEDEQEPEEGSEFEQTVGEKVTRNLTFSGRLSAVLPRNADPTIDQDMKSTPVTESFGIVASKSEPLLIASGSEPSFRPAETPARRNTLTENFQVLDMTQDADQELTSESNSAAVSSRPDSLTDEFGVRDVRFGLRENDLNTGHFSESDSEDELASPSKRYSITPASQRVRLNGNRASSFGFTSLTSMMDEWGPASGIHDTRDPSEQATITPSPSLRSEEVKSVAVTRLIAESANPHFFDDEMTVTSEPPVTGAPVAGVPMNTTIDEPYLEDVKSTREDAALAQEANDMSLMDASGHEFQHDDCAQEDGLSEASQEYGDENQIPIDPMILAMQPETPSLPLRTAPIELSTTTKVPLKSADHSTPSPLKKRSHSASGIVSRPPQGGLTRSATVISYSPRKERRSTIFEVNNVPPSVPSTPTPTNAADFDLYSTANTPARTPRRDVDPTLLRGAVVFVDVHTSEGADASGIFVELLTAMGARCVKSWNWNPVNSASPHGSGSKIGITHVVYKDGGKRTLERVRQSQGVVQCVGVSWVLDCERENKWIDENAYRIDTRSVPRGGGRRRKSMEPKMLTNMNGTLVSTPSKGPSSSSSREMQLGTHTPMNRRQSTIWMHTSPSDHGEEGGGGEPDWSNLLLTPVPVTPAPEAIARFAAEMPLTPTGVVGDFDASSPTTLQQQAQLMQTCPPKASKYQDLGEGILGSHKDEQVLMRLMAVRRKSLQFAPKVGSPLSRAWE